MPGRYLDRGAADNAASAAAGNRPEFASVMIWMSMVAFLGLLVVVILGAVAGRRRQILVYVTGAAYLVGCTALVIHWNASGEDGDAPTSILEVMGRVKVGDTFESKPATAGITFTAVDRTSCADAAHRLLAPSAEIPHCRDALQLVGTGWATRWGGAPDNRPGPATGGVSCVLFVPDLGHDTGGWKERLEDVRPVVPAPGEGVEKAISYDNSYGDGEEVWTICSEHRGDLLPGKTGAPMIQTIVDLTSSVEFGFL
jgi:hypothetical protein